MNSHLKRTVIAISTLFSALALVACGGGTSADVAGSSMSTIASTDASTTDPTTTSTDASTADDSSEMSDALRYHRNRTSQSTASSATPTATVAKSATPVATIATASTTTVTTTTATTTAAPTATVATATLNSAAGPTAVTVSWASPAANTKVSGMQTVKLSGHAFDNVEIFSGGVRIATAAVSSDLSTATATIDTTKLANGTEPLTAHAWNSAAGTAFTSDADAGTLALVVSNASTTTTAAAAVTATTPTVASATPTPTTTTTTTTAAATAPAAAATTSTASAGTLLGVNIHTGGGNTTSNQKIADVLSARGLKTARMDFNNDLDLPSWRDQVTRLKAYGIKAETGLQNSYQWDHSCNQSLAAVEQDSYNQTVTMVQRIGDIVQDFELLNEVSLRSELTAQVPPYQATPASGYAGKSCYATMASVLRGMSRAIVDQRNATSQPYKIILGAVGNDFGFLTFMQQQGVTIDVVGFHVYPSMGSPLIATDSWYGAGGPLAQLALFKKPVRINEFNCGEIYNSSYDNVAGSSATNTCLASIQKQLQSLLMQKLVTLDSVHAYELIDEPGLAGAESRFGLMYDLNTPKSLLAAYSLFAGGTISTSEKTQLTTAGVTGK